MIVDSIQHRSQNCIPMIFSVRGNSGCPCTSGTWNCEREYTLIVGAWVVHIDNCYKWRIIHRTWAVDLALLKFIKLSICMHHGIIEVHAENCYCICMHVVWTLKQITQLHPHRAPWFFYGATEKIKEPGDMQGYKTSTTCTPGITHAHTHIIIKYTHTHALMHIHRMNRMWVVHAISWLRHAALPTNVHTTHYLW